MVAATADRSISAALVLVRQSKMWSLLPFLLSSGLLWAFVIDDFTSKVVKPNLGEDTLGFIMAINGASSVLAKDAYGIDQ